MIYKIKLDKFEGPLDLLLQLIESEDLPITEVSLAKVTEQYVEHLQTLEQKNPDELADFLVVAAKLLLIKSRVLLPVLEVGLEEDGFSLEDQLKLYREYAAASRRVGQFISKHRFAFAREKALFQTGVFAPPIGVTPKKLVAVFLDVLSALLPIMELPKSAVLRTLSIKEKIEELRSLILKRAETSFSAMIRGARNKTEIIVSFLALLELIKQKIINVSQENIFEDISIKRI